jgi:cell division ATPase FtsA
MTGVCSIIISREKAFIALATFKKLYLTFIEELEVNLSSSQDDILAFLKENLEILGKKIKTAEEKHSLKIKKVFLGLPFNCSNQKIVNESVPLKRKKQVTSRDISFAKKQIEDKFLDWDDLCLHDIALNYRVAGEDYKDPPLGVWAKKIEISSLLIWIKDKVFKEAIDTCDSLGKDFGGFIDYHIGLFSSAFTHKNNNQIVIDLGYDRASYVISQKDSFIFGEELDLTLKKAIGVLAGRFSLDFDLAYELFMRYISFKETPYFKEVTIKRGDAYVKLSTQSLNSFFKEYLKEELMSLVLKIKNKAESESLEFSFIGSLNDKDGFYSFLKSCIPYPLTFPSQKSALSSSYGCLRYGVTRFLERDYLREESLSQRILRIYREYF